jgi:hypothetical protein
MNTRVIMSNLFSVVDDKYSEACLPYESTWHDACYSLSRRKCSRSVGCSYDIYSKACFPAGDEDLLKELSSESEWEDDHFVDCANLQNHDCKAASYCWYDRYTKSCFPFEDSNDCYHLRASAKLHIGVTMKVTAKVVFHLSKGPVL